MIEYTPEEAAKRRIIAYQAGFQARKDNRPLSLAWTDYEHNSGEDHAFRQGWWDRENQELESADETEIEYCSHCTSTRGVVILHGAPGKLCVDCWSEEIRIG